MQVGEAQSGESKIADRFPKRFGHTWLVHDLPEVLRNLGRQIEQQLQQQRRSESLVHFRDATRPEHRARDARGEGERRRETQVRPGEAVACEAFAQRVTCRQGGYENPACTGWPILYELDNLLQ
jgi:hypothetical protein